MIFPKKLVPHITVCSSDGNTNYVYVVRVLQGDTSSPFPNQSKLWIMNINRSDERKQFHTKNTRGSWYLTETITSKDYADDLVFLAKTPAQGKSVLHRLEQATRGSERRQNRVHASWTKGSHFHIKWQASEISRLVQILW